MGMALTPPKQNAREEKRLRLQKAAVLSLSPGVSVGTATEASCQESICTCS